MSFPPETLCDDDGSRNPHGDHRTRDPIGKGLVLIARDQETKKAEREVKAIAVLSRRVN